MEKLFPFTYTFTTNNSVQNKYPTNILKKTPIMAKRMLHKHLSFFLWMETTNCFKQFPHHHTHKYLPRNGRGGLSHQVDCRFMVSSS